MKSWKLKYLLAGILFLIMLIGGCADGRYYQRDDDRCDRDQYWSQGYGGCVMRPTP